jgi:hypothetical protein
MKIPRNSLAGIRGIMRFVVFLSYFKKRMIDFLHAYVTLLMTEWNQAWSQLDVPMSGMSMFGCVLKRYYARPDSTVMNAITFEV